MPTYCKVSHCRFPQTHTTKYNICGSCNIRGHGQVECNNTVLKNQLALYLEELPDALHCSFSSCDDPETHTSVAHQCELCCKYGHPENDCQLIDKVKTTIICPVCREENSAKLAVVVHEVIKECAICYESKNKSICLPCGHITFCELCLPNMIKVPYIITLKIQDNEFGNEVVNILGNAEENTYCRIYGGMGSLIYATKNNNQISKYLLHGDSMGQYGVDDRPLIAYIICEKTCVKSHK